MIPPLPNSSQSPAETGLSLSDIADIANVVVAALAFIFSIISLGLQRRLERQNKLEMAESQAKSQIQAEKLQGQTIRLQWYKDLVITPNMGRLNDFYEALNAVRGKINTPNIDEAQKQALIEEVKEAQRLVRKTLVDSILPINEDLHNRVLDSLDQLIDQITIAIDDDTLKLSNPTVNEQRIGHPIRIAKRDIFTLIYGYRGE